ncbi:MAG TPA: beta-propeller fold lactonase family protein [Acidobacteriaceae bacterium]|jgi:6-phosphogluconolactonase (cycloisomerase 2 family)|nr:beta-propeller fold lactonase family protein [Acidobacteriaceae bacterium]
MMHKSVAIRLSLLLLLAILPGVIGCAGFFIPPCQANNDCNNTPTSANYVYVANQTTNTVAGFSLTTGKLATLSGSPFALQGSPAAMVTTPGGTLLYTALTSGSVYVYTIGTNGALTIGNNGTVVASTLLTTNMAIDKTGGWLFLVSSSSPQLLEYQINTSTGVLTAPTTASYTLTGGAPTQIYVTPNNAYVYIGLGTGGVDIFTLNSTTGALSNHQHLKSLNSTTGADNAIGSDANSKFLFVGETGSGIRSFTIGTNGGLSEVSGSPFKAGLGPASIVMDPTNAYVYIANKTASSVAGYTLGSAGKLTQLSASPFTAGTSPISMSLDATSTYLAVASSGGSPDLQIFSFDAATPGTLDAASNATTGTDPTGPIAVSVAQ